MPPSQPLRFGIVRNQNMEWDPLLRHVLFFEELGFDSIWFCDHFQRPSRPDDPCLEGWTTLAALAALTSQARLGLLVTSNTFRHPSLVAKQALTVDQISDGRLEVGLGTGWFEPEHDRFGIDFPPTGELVGRFQEAVEIIDRALREETVSYDGTYYHLADAPFRPRPVQQPRPPLTLGAHGPRMLRIVARYADRWNSYGTLEEIKERSAALDEACAEVGRDPSEIIRSLYGWTIPLKVDPWSSVEAFRDVVGRYLEIGISEFLMEAPFEDQFGVAERVAADVLASR
ncbi:MAG TPA: TIGR03560 family F420-dependent LLM class oxidoreductase [Thermomicrobiales bacterium]|nr:TIGR03560 family F420-dependent LLM class oxidoreductase [Thermomicrobiales bacterium]